jgi:hypothetical protein
MLVTSPLTTDRSRVGAPQQQRTAQELPSTCYLGYEQPHTAIRKLAALAIFGANPGQAAAVLPGAK